MASRRQKFSLFLSILCWLACIWLVCTFFVSCNSASPVEPSNVDPREAWVLSETTRVAALLHVKVKGEVTNELYTVQCPNSPERCFAAGWYVGGVAYYWRHNLLQQDMTYGTGLAIHEVCHAKAYFHDAKHEACMASVQ